MHQYIRKLTNSSFEKQYQYNSGNVCSANIKLCIQHVMIIFMIMPAAALRLLFKCILVLADMGEMSAK